MSLTFTEAAEAVVVAWLEAEPVLAAHDPPDPGGMSLEARAEGAARLAEILILGRILREDAPRYTRLVIQGRLDFIRRPLAALAEQDPDTHTPERREALALDYLLRHGETADPEDFEFWLEDQRTPPEPEAPAVTPPEPEAPAVTAQGIEGVTLAVGDDIIFVRARQKRTGVIERITPEGLDVRLDSGEVIPGVNPGICRPLKAAKTAPLDMAAAAVTEVPDAATALGPAVPLVLVLPAKAYDNLTTAFRDPEKPPRTPSIPAGEVCSGMRFVVPLPDQPDEALVYELISGGADQPASICVAVYRQPDTLLASLRPSYEPAATREIIVENTRRYVLRVERA